MHDGIGPAFGTNSRRASAERILVLDGAYGTAIQGRDLTDGDYRGERFRDHAHDVKGDPDLLNLTRPDVVEEIHRSYLEAGADIVTTNTFTATAIAQADYGLEEAVLDINRAGAQIARRAVDAFGPTGSWPARSARRTRRCRSRRT